MIPWLKRLSATLSGLLMPIPGRIGLGRIRLRAAQHQKDQSIASALRWKLLRHQFTLLAILAVLWVGMAVYIASLARESQQAEQAFATSSQQIVLAQRLATLLPLPPPVSDRQADLRQLFAASLAQLGRNHGWLTTGLATGTAPRHAPALANAALTKIYFGAGPNLDWRMRELFAMASATLASTDPADLLKRGDALRADILNSVLPVLESAQGQFRQNMQQASQFLWQAIILAAAALLVLLILLSVYIFRQFDMKAGRVITALEALAAQDPTTGALSRTAFGAQVRRLLRGPASGEIAPLGLVVFEIDGLYETNNVIGQNAADTVLRTMTTRLQDSAGAGAIVGRLGFGSFGVALPDFPGGHDGLGVTAYRLLGEIQHPIQVEERLLTHTATAGTALAPDDTTDRTELLRMAQVALLLAKNEQKGTVRPFDSADRPEKQRQAAVLRALTTGDLSGVVSWFQPLLRCDTMELVGYEALARWDVPGFGWTPPSEFIAAAIASGRMSLLSAYVLRAALTAFKPLRAAATGTVPPRLSINLSAYEVARPETLTELDATLAALGLTPSCLVIDVTEEVIIDGIRSTARDKLEELRARGARIALDDFGTGFASLVHLHRFPVDVLKIDRTFISGIGTDARVESIVRGIIGLAKGLSIETVAEGVETEAQTDFLRTHGCDLIQGYFVSRPLPPALIPDWLRTHSRQVAAQTEE